MAESSARGTAQWTCPRFRSLTRKILYPIGVGLTAVIVLSSAVSYYLLYRTIERSAMTRLAGYSEQRARYQESHFALMKRLHAVVSGDLVETYRRIGTPEAEHRFGALMTRYPDGAMRNSARYADVEHYSSGWMHRRVRPDGEFKRRSIAFFDLSEKQKGIF